MAFSVARLVDLGYPEDIGEDTLDQVLEDTEQRLLERYADTRGRAMQRSERLDQILGSGSRAWQSDRPMGVAAENLKGFLLSIRRNYSLASPAVVCLSDTGFRGEWKARLRAALLAYRACAREWRRLIASRCANLAE
jgi:hypothetical protein